MIGKTIVLFAALSIAPAVLSAQEFRAENHVKVTGVAGGFEVANGGGYGARGMWCAAADYARRVLGAHGHDRVYIAVARTPGLGQRAPVRFTLDPAGLNPSSVTIVGASLRKAGASLSVDHAYQFCADAKVINR
ncbi:MAG: hypothetical protein WA782_09580 [Sulfitobacter sp.]